MISIGVGIDYALFIVTRYREVLGSGRDPETAVVVALDTAGRAVLFAGSTVVIALLGLLVLNTETFRGVAIGTALGVLVTMLASVTLLPALLGFVGRNIDRFGLPRRKQHDDGNGFWHRWAGFVQRRRWPAFLGALVLLVLIALPVFSMRLGFGDDGNKPAGDTSREAYDLLAKGFGPGFNGPLLIAAETPGGASDLAVLTKLSHDLNATPGVAFATPPRPNAAGDAAIMQVIPTTSPQDKATNDLVDHVRQTVVPEAVAGTDVTVAVGGLPAAVDDFANYTFRMLPLVVGLVLLLSFVLLMIVFRSVLVPLKAVVMNLLSVGAAYGVMVAVFQWGWGINIVGVGKEGPIEAWAPLMLFAVVFGLSMDYEVFLLSRIREEWRRTGDSRTSVADGLASTAKVISAAAAIMVVVFGSFVLEFERTTKMMGVGLAAAILLDATVVRMLLVPSTMELLGDKNWWIPRWLDRILPHLDVEGDYGGVDVEELARLTEEAELEPAGAGAGAE
jgi:RND superfamily putative drug exporter